MTAEQIKDTLAAAGIVEDHLISLTFGEDEVEVMVTDEDGYHSRVDTDRLRGRACKALGWDTWNSNETWQGALRFRPGTRPPGVFYFEMDEGE